MFGVVEVLAAAACWLGDRVRDGCDGLLSATDGIGAAASLSAMSESGEGIGAWDAVWSWRLIAIKVLGCLLVVCETVACVAVECVGAPVGGEHLRAANAGCLAGVCRVVIADRKSFVGVAGR